MKTVTTSNLTQHAKPLSFRQSLMMLASATVVTLSLSAPSYAQSNDVDGFNGFTFNCSTPAITSSTTNSRFNNDVSGSSHCIEDVSFNNSITGSINTLGESTRNNDAVSYAHLTLPTKA